MSSGSEVPLSTCHDAQVCLWAASSIRDAMAITAVRAHSRSASVPHEALHVYRVRLVPVHIGPLAAIDVLQGRLETAAAGAIEKLIREYWSPTGIWHLQEIVAERLTILEEVPATSERDIYLRRWVHYNLDRARAETL